MSSIHHHLGCLLVETMVIIVCAGAVARAQNDADVEERVELNRPVENPALRAEQARQRLQAAYKSQFDRWVLSQFRTRDGARQQLEMLLAIQMRKLKADCHLRADQQQKLELARRGDIKHFLDRFDHIARTLEETRSSVDDLLAAMREMQPLMTSTRQRLFSDDSLLAKTLATTLDPQQKAAREKALAEKNRELHRAAMESAVSTLRTNVGLTEQQGTRLEQLLKWTALKSRLASWADAESMLKKQGFVLDNGPLGVAKVDPREL